MKGFIKTLKSTILRENSLRMTNNVCLSYFYFVLLPSTLYLCLQPFFFFYHLGPKTLSSLTSTDYYSLKTCNKTIDPEEVTFQGNHPFSMWTNLSKVTSLLSEEVNTN